MEVRGSVAMVTGGGAGLGRAIAHALATEGARVLVVDVDPRGAQEVAREITSAGGVAEAMQADVGDDHDVGAMVTWAMANGGPHILVNNAGGWGGAGRQFPDAATAEWGAVLDLNLRAAMVATQRSLEPMRRAGGGAVVNIASSAGIELRPYGSPEYAAAKAGLVRFSASLGHLRESSLVRVSCVVPGWIGLPRAHTELAGLSPQERAAAPELVPPEVVAACVVDLARDERAAGRVVVLDGGQPPRVLDPAGLGGYLRPACG